MREDVHTYILYIYIYICRYYKRNEALAWHDHLGVMNDTNEV